MAVAAWASVVLSACATALRSSPATVDADPTCQVGEVSRLLWTMIVVAAAVGVLVVVLPSWPWVAALAMANLVWLWVDMEGPVLMSRGTHGLHLADVPVVISGADAVIAAARLLAQRRAAG